MTDLNKTTCLGNVCYKSGKQVALTDAQFGTELQNFVSQIAMLLVLCVELLELRS
jgi:hypothetical protein